MRQHLMIDLESLGTKANTAVLSMGAVTFNQLGVIAEIYTVPSLKFQLQKTTRAVDADTLHWWMNQDDRAKKVFSESMESSLTVQGLCSELSVFIDKFVKNKKDLIVWSNGAGFDVPIIEHMLQYSGLEIPWKFWNIRCYRTLKSLFPIENHVKKAEVKHNALDDAKFQAACVMKFLSEHPQYDK